jgi:drug/metabolite transporter (DMT)-like permease
VGIVLSILAAAVYGAGDFFGGLASKRTSLWTVMPISSGCGLLVALAGALILSPGAPPKTDLELGALVGVVGGGAIAFLYRGLAIARMSVVAPLTAVIAAIVPVVFGILTGERLSALTVTGIVFALCAVALISSSANEDVAGLPEARRSGLFEGVGAGVGFGIIYVLLSETSHGIWPLVAARTVSAIGCALIALLARRLIAPPRKSLGTIAASGMLDMGANIFYMLSLRYTIVAIAAVITSLYPATTVMLARLVLHERLGAVQWAGVACAGAGVALIALGR